MRYKLTHADALSGVLREPSNGLYRRLAQGPKPGSETLLRHPSDPENPGRRRLVPTGTTDLFVLLMLLVSLSHGPPHFSMRARARD